MLEKELLSFGSGILASVFANVLGDGGEKAASGRKKKKLEQDILDDLDSRVRDCMVQEHVQSWIFEQEYHIKQAGCIFGEEDKQRIVEAFFRKHPEIKAVYGSETEAVLSGCMDRMNDWANSILDEESKLMLAVIRKDGLKRENNIITQIDTGNRELLKSIQELQEKSTAAQPAAVSVREKRDARARAAYYDEIQNLYRIQNYWIRTKGGCFVAEQRSGIIRTRALVIPVCPETDELSVEDIGELLEILGREGAAYQYIHIVTNGVVGKTYEKLFSPYADKIEIYNERDIIHGIMDFTGYLNDTINQYKSSSLYEHYIEVLDTNTGASLEDSARAFLQEEEYNAFLILGDYGCGKTSFLLNFACRLAEEYCQEENGYIPLFIPLKEYAKAVSMENLLMDLFVNKCQMAGVSMEAFKLMLRYMKFVLLFDGFDEVAKRVNYDVKFDIFNQICQFCGENTKIIITCRPNYFQENREYKRLMENAHLQFEPNVENKASFYETYIADLTPEQIHQYILSYEPLLKKEEVDVYEMEELIAQTHDLTDLSRRPFLLSIIVKTLPKIISNLDGKRREDITINAAELYRNYTELWLDRENAKGKALIRKEDKLQFCMHIAYKMFRDDILSIHFSDMPDEIREYFPDLHQMDEIDYFSHDIQSCSFMNSEGDGNFKFIHKSFMEYFVACFIVGKLRKDAAAGENTACEVLSGRDVSTEIALFINDILCGDTELYQKVIDILEEQANAGEDMLRQNAMTILSKMQYDIAENIEDGESYARSDFSYSTIADRIICGVNFSGATFYNATIEDVQFIKCCFDGANFQKASLKNVNFSYQSLEYANLSYSVVTHCDFTQSILTGAKMSYARLHGNDFMQCDMSETETDGIRYKNNHNCRTVIGAPYEMR